MLFCLAGGVWDWFVTVYLSVGTAVVGLLLGC